MNERGLVDAIALLLASGVGSRTGKLLIEQFRTATAAFAASRDDLLHVGLTREQVESLRIRCCGPAWRVEPTRGRRRRRSARFEAYLPMP
jgi:hypothetical protein